jgi:hypothetical protein
MFISRPVIALALVASLGLAACGGSDDSSSDDPAAAEASPPEATDESAGDDGAPSDSGESGDAESGSDGGSSSAPLSVTATIPVAGGIGETIALAPDGSRLAHLEGGIELPITVYDTATGDVIATSKNSGQGLGMLYTADGKLVTWNPGPLSDTDAAVSVADPATLEQQPSVTPTYPTGLANCGVFFGIQFDADRNVAFAIEGADDGTNVCRLDLSTNEVLTTTVPTTGGLPTLLLSPDGSQVFVNDGGPIATSPATAFVLDSTTLEQIEAVDLPGSASAATTSGLVVPIDRFSDQFLDTGVPLPAQVVGSAGPYLIGNLDGEIIVMNRTDGTVVGSAGTGFVIEAGATADGSVLAIRTSDAISLIQL